MLVKSLISGDGGLGGAVEIGSDFSGLGSHHP